VVLASQGSWENPEFAQAFDNTPNQYSPEALTLYMTYKAIDQDLKYSSIERIHAAFKNLWSQR
jgi:hypothetical protein